MFAALSVSGRILRASGIRIGNELKSERRGGQSQQQDHHNRNYRQPKKYALRHALPPFLRGSWLHHWLPSSQVPYIQNEGLRLYPLPTATMPENRSSPEFSVLSSKPDPLYRSMSATPLVAARCS